MEYSKRENTNMKPKRLFRGNSGPRVRANYRAQKQQRMKKVSPAAAMTTSSNPTKISTINETRPTTTGKAKAREYICSSCNESIKDKYLLEACDKYWHEDCLKCDRCQANLGELGSTLYSKGEMNLCRQDYLEIFGQTAICSVCEKLIYASEMVMRAKQNVYHLECFACQLCGQRFCVGDRFFLFENKIVCQFDYEEHILPLQKSLFGRAPTTESAESSTCFMQPQDGLEPVIRTEPTEKSCDISAEGYYAKDNVVDEKSNIQLASLAARARADTEKSTPNEERQDHEVESGESDGTTKATRSQTEPSARFAGDEAIQRGSEQPIEKEASTERKDAADCGPKDRATEESP